MILFSVTTSVDGICIPVLHPVGCQEQHTSWAWGDTRRGDGQSGSDHGFLWVFPPLATGRRGRVNALRKRPVAVGPPDFRSWLYGAVTRSSPRVRGVTRPGA